MYGNGCGIGTMAPIIRPLQPLTLQVRNKGESGCVEVVLISLLRTTLAYRLEGGFLQTPVGVVWAFE